eukprot:Nitzschia sp. Nitz4//scaffold95_size97785//60021//61599//NITZ4_004672-RA/size97785-augustus-gene-0.109-mRNA-1//-1//CDS//3329560487//4028//frame0
MLGLNDGNISGPAASGQSGNLNNANGWNATAFNQAPAPQGMGALALMQPLLTQNLLQQHLQQNNAQKNSSQVSNAQSMIQNLLMNSQNQPQEAMPHTISPQPQQQNQSYTHVCSPTPPQAPVNPQVEVLQNLVKLASQMPLDQSSNGGNNDVNNSNSNNPLTLLQNLLNLGSNTQPMSMAENAALAPATPSEQSLSFPVASQQGPASPPAAMGPQLSQADMLQNLLNAGMSNGLLRNQPPAPMPAPPQNQQVNPNALLQNLLSQMAGGQAQDLGVNNSMNSGMNNGMDNSLSFGSNNMALSIPPQLPPAGEQNVNVPSGRKHSLPIPLFLDYDVETLTEYQCLLRQQIELFEAGPEDIKASAQGRNNPILLGQVGIRCRHCTQLPLKCRPRGAVYYSRTIDGLYQVAQNMSKLHFCKTCNQIPAETRAKLATLQKVNRRAAGGKEYWSEGLRVLGVYEDGTAMRFRGSSTRSSPVVNDSLRLENNHNTAIAAVAGSGS